MTPDVTVAGRLRGTLERMLDWRVAAGYAAKTHRDMLSPFVDHVVGRWPNEPLLTAAMVDGWLVERAYTTNSQRIFISCLRELSRFSNFEGVPDFVPGHEYSVSAEPYEPYVFTAEELAALFHAVDSYEARSHNGRRLSPELVLPVWTRLLYCCGMRPGEPPSLLREDVDLSTGDMVIRQSKRHRDRHIMASEGVTGLLASYDSMSPADRTWFFERWDGRPYGTNWYDHAWRRVVDAAGVAWRGRVRPYDLRHQFASENITRWMDSGRDALELLPALSAYMGHSKLGSTLYYVHLLPERLRRSPGVDWDSISPLSARGGDRA